VTAPGEHGDCTVNSGEGSIVTLPLHRLHSGSKLDATDPAYNGGSVRSSRGDRVDNLERVLFEDHVVRTLGFRNSAHAALPTPNFPLSEGAGRHPAW
jgi:hypothetical protein